MKAQLSEEFEGTVFPPDGWLVTDNMTGSVPAWEAAIIPYQGVNGTKGAIINRENIGQGNTSEEWLVTSGVNLTGNELLSFYSRQTLAGVSGTLYEVRMSTTSQTDQSSFVTIAPGANTASTKRLTLNSRWFRSMVLWERPTLPLSKNTPKWA